MTSYEIVKRTITFDHPERVALKYPTLGDSDIVRLFLQTPRKLRADDKTPDMRVKPKRNWGEKDEWGVVWENTEGEGLGLGQNVGWPVENWDESYSAYQIPDAYEPGRFDGLEEILAISEKEEKWVQLNAQYCLFERIQQIRGFENTLIDMYTDREKFEELCDRLLEYQLGIVRQVAELGKGRIHSIDISDDWGTQEALLINPDMWREIFKPRYKILIDEMHSLGIYCDFHSCGKINDILEDFVELGVDMVNIHQPHLLGMDEVSEKYAGRIAFDVAVDIQEVLPTGDKALIEQDAKDIISKWGTPAGGVVAAEYRFLKAIGATQESFEYSLEAFKKFGKLQ
jgi:hypothetical protein